MPEIICIVCTDESGIYSIGNNIPWHCSEDLQFFKETTTGYPVIVGGNTFRSFPKSGLPGRELIVLSRKEPDAFNSPYEIMDYIQKFDKVFVAGAYDVFFKMQVINKVILNRVNIKTTLITDIKQFTLPKQFTLTKSCKISDCLESSEYKYTNKEETKYLKYLTKIVNTGTLKSNRTGVSTFSLFGKSFKYDLREYRLPLFGHRKIFIRGIIEELLFFVSGSTDTKVLESKGVNIWKGNTSRAFLDSVGLFDYPEGSYGPSYGFQLRHFGAEVDSDGYSDNNGFDQLEYIVDLLKNNPDSRRILFTYWNPLVLKKVPLPSCHLLYNFYVSNGELSVSFYQRSSDFALACNFNIVSASLLVFMLCKVTGLKPGKCIHNIGDAHVYENQVGSIQEFINNEPTNFPLCQVRRRDNINDFTVDDFKIIGYNPHKKYSIPFVV
jgi:thymidylate synthase